MKLKVLSAALSLVVLCSSPIANAGSQVAGQLIANPLAIVSSGAIEQKVGSQKVSYIEGDTILTKADSNAEISLTSGLANVVVAPNTVMSVTNASETNFSLTQGAFSVDAKAGQVVTVETLAGLFQLTSNSAVNAIVTFQNGEFAAVSKDGVLNVQADDGVVTVIDSGGAFVFNAEGEGATSVEVQAAGGDVHEHENSNGEFTSHAHDGGLVDHSHGTGYFNVNNGLIVGGLVIGTALLSGTFSDGDDADSASPAE